MNEPKEAAFSLSNYKILEFYYKENDFQLDGVSIGFDPTGKYLIKEKKFIVNFGFFAFMEQQENPILKVVMEATFKFKNELKFEELPDYFYRNSIAIVFPYLRAFVTTLTVLGNSHPLILPVLNLTDLEPEFKRNTIVVE